MDALDKNETRDGYFCGLWGGAEPHNCTRSYWHGWKNGAVDGGYAQMDASQIALAREYAEFRLHGLQH